MTVGAVGAVSQERNSGKCRGPISERMALTYDAQADLWRPTRRQQMFRTLAELLWFDGQAGIANCLRISRVLAAGIQPDPQSKLWDAIDQGLFAWQGRSVNVHEYKRWEDEDGFHAWWAEAFPEVEGPTRTDMMQADGFYWAALVQGLASGERSHMQIYAQIKLANDKAQPTKGSLDGHFEEPDDADNGWLE